MKRFLILGCTAALALISTPVAAQNVDYNARAFNDTTTPLAGGATFTGASRDVGQPVGNPVFWRTFTCFFRADQASATNGAQLQGSNDGTTWFVEQSTTLSASAAGVGGTSLSGMVYTRYHRCVLVNGATPQTSVVVNSQFGT